MIFGHPSELECLINIDDKVRTGPKFPTNFQMKCHQGIVTPHAKAKVVDKNRDGFESRDLSGNKRTDEQPFENTTDFLILKNHAVCIP